MSMAISFQSNINNNFLTPLKNASERCAFAAKKLTESFYGLSKLAGVIGPILSIVECCTGEKTAWAAKFLGDLRVVGAVNAGLGWTATAHDLHVKGWSEGFLAGVKRVAAIGFNILLALEYACKIFDKVDLLKITTLCNVPIKLILLEVMTLASLIKGGIDWRDKSVKIRDLKAQLRHLKKDQEISEDYRSKLESKVNAKFKRIQASLQGIELMSSKERKNLLRKKVELLNQIHNLDPKSSQAEELKKEFEDIRKKTNSHFQWTQLELIKKDEGTDYLSLVKKEQMLSLIKDLSVKNCQDLSSLKKMDNNTFKKYKIKQLSVQKVNLSRDLTKVKLDVASNSIKFVVFGLGIASAALGVSALTSTAIGLTEKVYKIGLQCLNLTAGSIGLGKFFYDLKKKEAEPTPAEFFNMDSAAA